MAATRVHAVIPVPWLKEQVCFLLELMLQQCRTQYELGKLLQLFVGVEHLFFDGKTSLSFKLVLKKLVFLILKIF